MAYAAEELGLVQYVWSSSERAAKGSADAVLTLTVPVQLANFALVPAHLRIVTVNVVSLFWNTYLSYANSQAEKKPELEEKIKEISP